VTPTPRRTARRGDRASRERRADLRIVDEDDDDPGGAVPAPVPPDDPEARGTRRTCARSTNRSRGRRHGPRARRRPVRVRRARAAAVGADDRALDRVRDHFSGCDTGDALTRVGVIERAESGFEPKYERALDRLLDDASRAARRRIDYHALRDLRLLGDVTPLALDGRIGGRRGRRARTGRPHRDVRALGDRYRRRRGSTSSASPPSGSPGTRSASPGSPSRWSSPASACSAPTRSRRSTPSASPTSPRRRALIEECKQRIWETTVNGVVDDREAFVAEHARRFLSRRLTARNTRRGSARPPTEPAPRWPTAGSRSRRSTRGTPTIASTIWRTTCSATSSSAKES